HLQRGDVELRADRVAELRQVDALLREALPDRAERAVLDRELVDDRLRVLELRRALVGVDDHEGERVTGNDPARVVRRGGAARAPTAPGEERCEHGKERKQPDPAHRTYLIRPSDGGPSGTPRARAAAFPPARHRRPP